MAEYFKEPQNPLKKIDETTGDTYYVYPLTTDKQVKMSNGERLNAVVSEINNEIANIQSNLENITPDEIPAENVKMANGYSLELTLNGIWFDFTDADGNPTDEPHAHWLVDEETGEIATAGYLIAEEAEF